MALPAAKVDRAGEELPDSEDTNTKLNSFGIARDMLQVRAAKADRVDRAVRAAAVRAATADHLPGLRWSVPQITTVR